MNCDGLEWDAHDNVMLILSKIVGKQMLFLP